MTEAVQSEARLSHAMTTTTWARSGFWLAMLSIVVGALANQARLGVNTDPLWLMDLCGRLLDGQAAYVDFLENNPPFAILIYAPPVMASRLLGLNQDGAFVTYIALLALGSLWVSASIWRTSRRLPPIGGLAALTAVAALLALPDYAYGQRDHIDLILALPWLATMGLRAAREQPPPRRALASGIAAGLIFAIKPHYALSFLFVVAFVAWRRGARTVATSSEVVAAVGSACVFTLASVILFPAYITTMAPMALEVYARNRIPALMLIANPAIIATALLGAALFAWHRQVRSQPLVEVLIVAAAAGPFAYLAQGKWFAYHNYPSVALLLIAFAAVAKAPFSTVEANVATAVGAVAFAASTLFFVSDPSHFIREAELYFVVALLVLPVGVMASSASAQKFASALAMGCAFAAVPLSWQGFHSDWNRRPIFLDEIKARGGRPSIAIIGNYGGLGIPAANAVHGRWAMDFIGWILTDSANHLLRSAGLSESARAEIATFKTVEYDRFAATAKRDPAQLLIVDESWAQENLTPSEMTNILGGYVEVGRAYADGATPPRGLHILYSRKGADHS